MAAVQVRRRLLFGSLAVSAVFTVAAGCSDDNGATGVGATRPVTSDVGAIDTNDDLQGTRLADATVQTLDGADVATASLIGGPMVINVWSSTCIPCREELPAFAAVHQQYGDDVRFIGIDYLGAGEIEERFARDRGVEYELFYDSNGEFIVATDLAAFPVTLFVRADGTIMRQTGALTQAELEQYVQELLQ